MVVVSGDHATIYIGAQETPQEAQERSRARIEELMRRLEALVQPGRLEDARAIVEQHLGREAA